MFVTKKVFDPALVGKAVHISGHDIDGDSWNGLHLVKGIDGERMQIIDRLGKDYLMHMENFENGDLLKMEVLQLPGEKEDEPVKKKAITRNVRSAAQRKKENIEIERILMERARPMRLEGILVEMRKRNYLHWNNKNASGHVKQAIKDGYRIRKVSTGIYQFDNRLRERVQS